MSRPLGAKAAKILKQLEGRSFGERYIALKEEMPLWFVLIFLEEELPKDFFDRLLAQDCIKCLMMGWWCQNAETLHKGIIERMKAVATAEEWRELFSAWKSRNIDCDECIRKDAEPFRKLFQTYGVGKDILPGPEFFTLIKG